MPNSITMKFKIMHENKRRFSIFLIALLTLTALSFSGCGEESAEDKSGGVEIVESGYSLDNNSVWAVVRNDSENTYGSVDFLYNEVDSKGELLDPDCQLAVIIPNMRPGDTVHITSQLQGDKDLIADVPVRLEVSKPISGNSLDSIIPVPEIAASDIQLTNVDGSYITIQYSVANDTDNDYDVGHLYCLFKDDEGNYCGGNEVFVEELIPAHETVTIESDVTGYNGSDVEVYYRPFTEEEKTDWGLN